MHDSQNDTRGKPANDATPIAPATCSQRNCELVLGWTERQYLDFCRANPQLVTSVGKLRVVIVADLLAFLRSHRSEQLGTDQDVDNVLAMVGRSR